MDTLAEKFSIKYNLGDAIVFKPEYNRYPGRIAPLMRNTQIVELADYLIAFPDNESRGTWDSVRKANKKGIPVSIYKV